MLPRLTSVHVFAEALVARIANGDALIVSEWSRQEPYYDVMVGDFLWAA